MRDFFIDEEFDVPVTIDRERIIDEIITSEVYDYSGLSYEDLYQIISDCLDENIEEYRHSNGNVYVEDWSAFDEDLDDKIMEYIDNILIDDE